MSEDIGKPPDEAIEPSGEAAVEKGPFGGDWDRRTLFKGAALGTAAAAMYAGGRAAFGPLTAYGSVLTNVNCTANDVRIVGPGQVVNEPCSCTGTFDAQVSFNVINNTGTTRYCVTVHLCPGVDADGDIVVPAQDIIVGDIPAGFNGPKTVTIEDWPCGAGLVCFGEAGSGADGSFLKGETCPTGECCTVISWNVRPNDACPVPHGDIIKSKCRAQQVCIQGRGDTTIACPAAGCAVPCGEDIGLTVCTTEPSAEGPFIIELRLCDGTLVERYPASGTTTDKCHTFTVSPTEDTCYFGRVTSTQDDPDCVKDSDEVTVTTTAISPTLTVDGGVGCNTGVLTITSTAEGFSGCGTVWTIDGGTIDAANDAGAEITDNLDNTLTYRWIDADCHTVSATTTCGACNGSDSVTISQCVNTTQGCTP